MRARVRRRGAVYVAVLGTSLLVVSIGLGSLAVARSRMAIARQERDGALARHVADSALDGVLRTLAEDSGWRAHEGSDPWRADKPIAGGLVSVWLDDPEDGDLGDDAGDPVRVRIRAGAGGAARRLEAVVDLHRRVRVLEPRVASLEGIRISDSMLTGEGEMRTVGDIQAQNAEVYLDAVAPPAKTITGGTFHGLNRLEVVTGAMPTEGELDTAWGTGATVIVSTALPRGGTPLPGWELGAESGGGNWFPDHSVCAADVVCDEPAESAVEGGCAVRVFKRAYDWAGAYISIRDLLNSGVKPRMRVRVRLRDAADGPVDARLALTYRYGRWIPIGSIAVLQYSDWFSRVGAAMVCTEDWVDLEITTAEMSWNPSIWSVTEAWIDVETPGSTADHLIDAGVLYDIAQDATAPLLLHRVRLGPDSNPFGTPNADGRYVIDLEGRDLVIRDCVINGTLVLRRAGIGTRIEGSVAWTPVVPGDPIVIVEGPLGIATDGTPVQEEAIGVDLDGDGLRASVLPSILDGLVFARGRITVGGQAIIGGSLVSRNGIQFDGAAADFPPRRGAPNRIPAGFEVDAVEAVVRPGTLRILDGGGTP